MKKYCEIRKYFYLLKNDSGQILKKYFFHELLELKKNIFMNISLSSTWYYFIHSQLSKKIRLQ